MLRWILINTFNTDPFVITMSSISRRLWSKEELIVAFNLYLKLPFGQMHQNNAEIIKLAELINRTPSSVAMRLSNFASIDPYHQKRGIVGLPGGARQCQPIWDEFSENREELLYESERILAGFENQTLEKKYEYNLRDVSHLKGEEKERLVKTRVNQEVFRNIVLATYDRRCVISGIDLPELLVASHIIPWSRNEQERLNPENGICLSALYDKAFDRGLIGISSSYKWIVSKELKKSVGKPFFATHFGNIENTSIRFPERFKPRRQFLEYHLNEIFRG